MTDTITVTPPIPAGLTAAIEAAGHSVTMVGNGETWLVDNASAVQAIINSYAGGAQQLAYAQQQQLAALAAQYAAVIAAGAVVSVAGTNYAFPLDPVSQQKIAAAGSRAGLAAANPTGTVAFPAAFAFPTVAGALVAMSAAQAYGWAQAIHDYVLAVDLYNGDLAGEIAAATTVAAVEAINVASGWPANG